MNLKFKASFRYFVLAIFLGLFSCIEVYNPSFDLNQEVYIVESTITDEPGEQYVRLRRSVPSGYNDSYFLAVEGATVEVIKDGSQSIKFNYGEAGYYYPENSFVGEKGHSYQLKYSLPNGDSYQSTPQFLNTVADIETVYQRYTTDGVPYGNKDLPGHIIYLDTKDPGDEENYYYWTYKNYEKQPVCKSCEGGLFYTDPLPNGECIVQRNLQRSGTTYDYSCEGNCFDIFYSNNIEILNDRLSDGLTIKGKEIGRIPLYNDKGGLMHIKQYGLNKEAYEYFRLLRDQAKTTGSFADTPPAALIGNVKNISNLNEPVAGLFIVAGVSQKYYWIDRSEIAELKIQPFGMLGGRFINPEPATVTRPPLAPCIEADTRTKTTPEQFRIDLF